MNDSVTATSPHVKNAGRHGRLVLLVLLLAVLLTAADLGVKWAAFEYVAGKPVDPAAYLATGQRMPARRVTLIPYGLALQLTLNQGAVFGLGQGQKWLLVAVTLGALIFVGWVFAVSHAADRLFHIALALIVAGALGNLYDRLQYSAVRDMFYMLPNVYLPFGLRWPQFIGGSDLLYPWIFNLADVYLCIGIGYIILRSLVMQPEPPSAH